MNGWLFLFDISKQKPDWFEWRAASLKLANAQVFFVKKGICVFFFLSFSHIFSATPFFRFPPPPSSFFFFKIFLVHSDLYDLSESRKVLVPQPAQEKGRRYLKKKMRQQRQLVYVQLSFFFLFNNVCFLLSRFYFSNFISWFPAAAVQRVILLRQAEIMSPFVVLLFILLLCWIVRAGNGSRANVMMHVAVMSSASPRSRLWPMMAIVTIATYMMYAVGSRSRIPATRPRVNDCVMIAIGRIRAGRIHCWTGWYVAWFSHSV